MCGSGVWIIGAVRQIIREQSLPVIIVLKTARIAYTVAAAGATTPGAAVLLIGATASPTIAATTSVSASLLSQFNDRLSLQQQASPIRSGTDARRRRYQKTAGSWVEQPTKNTMLGLVWDMQTNLCRLHNQRHTAEGIRSAVPSQKIIFFRYLREISLSYQMPLSGDGG